MKAVIFDLDGTLALINKRRAKATRPDGKLNWKVFFDPENIHLDEPNVPVIEAFKLYQSAGYKMIIFSGRDSINKVATIDWLNEHGIHPNILKMRPQGTHTPDDILKRDWLYDLENLGISVKDVACVYDDRDKVVKMWREEGISCFQVEYGNF